MRIAPLTALSALALLALGSTGAPAQESGEPPIETVKTPAGETIRLQRYQRPAFAIELKSLSIAQRKMLRALYGALVDTDQAVRIECPALASGKLDPALTCRAAGPGDSDFMRVRLVTRALKLIASGFPPTIPEIPVSRARKLQRWAQFEVRLPAFPAAEPEPPAGPLVASTEIKGLGGAKAPVDYPAAALRREIGGRLVALCQVQTDLSVACVQDSFDPPQNAESFAQAAPALFVAGTVEPTLAGGGPSAGARFKYAVNFAIPDK